MTEEQAEYIIIDLGELSRTHFGNNVLRANLDIKDDEAHVSVDIGILERSFNCQRILRSGTYIISDEDGRAIGVSDEEYLLEQ